MTGFSDHLPALPYTTEFYRWEGVCATPRGLGRQSANDCWVPVDLQVGVPRLWGGGKVQHIGVPDWGDVTGAHTVRATVADQQAPPGADTGQAGGSIACSTGVTCQLARCWLKGVGVLVCSLSGSHLCFCGTWDMTQLAIGLWEGSWGLMGAPSYVSRCWPSNMSPLIVASKNPCQKWCLKLCVGLPSVVHAQLLCYSIRVQIQFIVSLIIST